jgi:hypothetical protein
MPMLSEYNSRKRCSTGHSRHGTAWFLRRILAIVLFILLVCKIFNSTVPIVLGKIVIYQLVDLPLERFKPQPLSAHDDELFSTFRPVGSFLIVLILGNVLMEVRVLHPFMMGVCTSGIVGTGRLLAEGKHDEIFSRAVR